jgi:hypothetical protein
MVVRPAHRERALCNAIMRHVPPRLWLEYLPVKGVGRQGSGDQPEIGRAVSAPAFSVAIAARASMTAVKSNTVVVVPA